MSPLVIVVSSPFGANTLEVGHDPYRQEIFVESDFQLSNSDMRRVEEELNLNMSLGARSNVKQSKTVHSKYLTSWSYIEGHDCDWT